MSEQHIKLPEGSIEKTTTTLNLGPTHPATHGVFQNILELDGERIVSAEQTVGYIHRAFEKIAERRPLYQITPLTDRLNYCSSPINNMGWHLTCEKLLGVKTPKRVEDREVPARISQSAERIREPVHAQPHFHGPHKRDRRHQCRTRVELWLHRTQPPCNRC